MKNKISFINSLTFQLDITSRLFYNCSKKQFEDDKTNKLTLEEYASENELAAFTKTILKIRNILISLGYVDI